MPTTTGNPGQFSRADGITLREYFDTRLAALEEKTRLADSVLQSQWERGHAEALAQLKAACDRLDGVESYRDRMEAKASQLSVYIAWILGGVGVVFGIIDLILKFAK